MINFAIYLYQDTTFYMPIHLYIIIFCMLTTATLSFGQSVQGIVIDAETDKPLSDVDVIINGVYNNKTKTNYKGEFLINGNVESLTFSKQGYEYRTLTAGELKDTILLLPNFNKLNEVVIIGKKPGTHMPVLSLINGKLKEMKNKPKSLVQGDFLSWLKVFEKGHVSAKKRKERMKAIENY